MGKTDRVFWLLKVVFLSLPYIIYQHVVLVLALKEILDSSCQFLSRPPLANYCAALLQHNDYWSRNCLTAFFIVSIGIQWLNNFAFFNLLYKLVLCVALQGKSPFFYKLRKTLYTSATFKACGLTSCNPAQLWPSLMTLRRGYLKALDDDAEQTEEETMAELRGVYRFVVNELDINIKTNRLERDITLWHVESITNRRDGTEVLLCEMTSQQVNLLIRTLQIWEERMPEIGVINRVSSFFGLMILNSMQLSEVLDHIKAGKEVAHIWHTGVHAFIA
ncbi:hypothetical protein O6H91_04G137400 [Diphasiastrum complanatum]|uniref:Uncharacterized protein n=1 Tax=Diphasiastrum complanatum TaxID=34168 RepID=A0ACC2E254_DIPCM|nr:hypothetical protein O6H91_04G137400 [Diphasiastrum complanatum]